MLNGDARAHESSIDLAAKLDRIQRTLDELPAGIAAAAQAAQPAKTL